VPAAPAATSTAIAGELTPEAYRALVMNLANRYEQARVQVTALSASPRPADVGWRLQLGTALNDLRAINADVRRTLPPDCALPVQDELLDAARSFDAVAAQADIALAAEDDQGIRAAARGLADGMEHVQNATYLLTQQASC
jgi:hypothetical protein